MARQGAMGWVKRHLGRGSIFELAQVDTRDVDSYARCQHRRASWPALDVGQLAQVVLKRDVLVGRQNDVGRHGRLAQ